MLRASSVLHELRLWMRILFSNSQPLGFLGRFDCDGCAWVRLLVDAYLLGGDVVCAALAIGLPSGAAWRSLHYDLYV